MKWAHQVTGNETLSSEIVKVTAIWFTNRNFHIISKFYLNIGSYGNILKL
jgi:hypothetical protein